MLISIFQIPNLATVLILSAPTPRPLLLHSAGVPYVHFPAYTQKEALTIALASPPPQVPQSISSNFPSTTIDKFYPPFLSTLLASLVLPSTSQALPALRAASTKLWPLFIAPILSGETPPGLSSSSPEWDFPRLLLRNRSLFQSESILLDRLVPPTPSTTTITTAMNRQTSTPNPPPTTKPKPPPLLPYLPTLTLLSALLASSVPSKQDPTIFSALTSSRKKSIRRRGKGRPPSAASTPTKSPNRVSKFSSSSTSTTLRPFPLERLTAILRTFASPSDLSSKKANEGAMSDLVITELTTLERLRLVVPTSAAGDALGEVKYKINVSKEFVRNLVREWGMESDWRNWEDVGIF
jgi:origin recognition complex subunit 5